MYVYEDEDSEETGIPPCPYCKSRGDCKHRLLDADATFGEFYDYGVYEDAHYLFVKCVLTVVKSCRKLPESLRQQTLASHIPFDTGDRPEPNEEAVRDWLADTEEWKHFREYYKGLLCAAGAVERDYYDEGGPGMTSRCTIYHSRAPTRACTAVMRAVKTDLKPFHDAAKGSRSKRT